MNETTATRRVLRQEAIEAVSADPVMAAEVDAEWRNDPELTTGQRIAGMTALCADVLRRHGYEVA